MNTKKDKPNKVKATKDFDRVIKLIKEIGYSHVLLVTLRENKDEVYHTAEGLLHGNTQALVEAVMDSPALEDFRSQLKRQEIMSEISNMLSTA